MPEPTKHTIIESGTELEGSIKSECAITLSGKLEGKVSAPELTVTPSGALHGQIKVSQLKAQGEVSGEIEADNVELSGRVSDQTVIRARTLEVMLTQPQGRLLVTFGTCELNVGDKPPRSAEENGRARAEARKDHVTDANVVGIPSDIIK